MMTVKQVREFLETCAEDEEVEIQDPDGWNGLRPYQLRTVKPRYVSYE